MFISHLSSAIIKNNIKCTRIIFARQSISITSKHSEQKPRLLNSAYTKLTRIQSPAGIWLLYWPCTWSITMACYNLHQTVDWKNLILFGAGAIIMRGAGCTINDLWDRNLDKNVDRTKERPLASGKVSVKKAIGFLGIQLSAGLIVLLQLNWYSIALGSMSLLPVILYPLMKRFTYWPQAVLGLTFNWGALLGWSAVAGYVNWPIALSLYFSGFFWTLVYDTIYAHQDKLDDVKVNIKSTALLFQHKTRAYLSCFAASSISLFSLAGYLNEHGWPFYSLTSIAGLHFFWQIFRTNFDDPKDCARKFKSNQILGGILFLAIFCDFLFRSALEKIVSLLLLE